MYDLTYMRNWLILIVLFTCNIVLPIFAQDEHTVVLYAFNNVSGDVVTDLSERGNDGKLTGTKLGDGKYQGGLVFGGNEAGDFVEIPDSDSLDLVDGLTVEMWVYLNSEPTGGSVGVTKTRTYKVGPRNNLKAELRLATTTNGWGANVISTNLLPLDKWVHIAGTYDAESGDGKIYIDGELDNEKNIGGDIVPNDNALWLGRGGNPYLDGSMDEVRISNIARSQNEIQELMNNGIVSVITAITPRNKLATTWGQLKSKIVDYK